MLFDQRNDMSHCLYLQLIYPQNGLYFCIQIWKASDFKTFQIKKMIKNTLLLLFFSPTLLFSADLALHIKTDKESALRGDTVACTIFLMNEGRSDVGNIAVQVVLGSGLKLLAPRADVGTYDSKSNLWSASKIGKDQAIGTLTGSILVLGEGPLLISAEVLRMAEPDDDSAAGNHLLYEDDIAYTCISVPIVFCGTDNIDLTAEAYPGFEGYQWKYEGQDIPNATERRLRITKTGKYSCTAKNTTFSFPVVVEKAPAFSIELGEAQTVCAGERLRMTVIPTGGTKPFRYSWSNDKGHDLKKSLYAGQELTLKATVTDARGCVAKDEVKVDVVKCKENG